MSEITAYTGTQTDSLNRYFSEISSVRMLTAAEEFELIGEYKTTENPIRKRQIQAKIIEGALKFVIKEARRQPKAIKDREALQDLIAAGNMGLVRALDKFDLSKGVRFLTYAGWWVRHEMREENKHLNICHVPTHAMAKGIPTPTPVELSDATIEYKPEEDSDELLHNRQSVERLLSITQLNTRESFIIRSCFGINTKQRTLKQVGKVLVITGERVRQLRETALNKLKASAATTDY